MGFGNVASTLILLIAVLVITTGVVISLKDYYDRTSTSVALTQSMVTKELRTDINIDVVNFVNTTNTTYIYVKNTGNEKLDPENIDVYIDSIYIPRNGENRTSQVLSDTELHNTATWDPKEQLYIQVFNFSLDENSIHELTISTQYGVKDTYEFTI